MDPLQVPIPINQSKECAQDVVIDLDGNVFENQVDLGLISELKSLAKVISNVIGQSVVELVKSYSVEPSYILQ